MLLRILLILALLAGLGVIAVSQFKIRPHIQGIIEERQSQSNRADTAEANLRKTTKQLKDTEQTLGNTKKQLAQTEKDLAATKIEVQNEQDRANKLKQTLSVTSSNLLAVQQELSAWKNLLIPVEKVGEIIASEKKLRADLDVMEQEKKILLTEVDRQRKIIEAFLGKNPEVEFPLPKMAKVLAVDPKWNFVILDAGTRQNVTNNCVGLVSHNGKLVAKVKVTSVQADRSIANVAPGWNLGEIMEGDLVLPPFE